MRYAIWAHSRNREPLQDGNYAQEWIIAETPFEFTAESIIAMLQQRSACICDGCEAANKRHKVDPDRTIYSIYDYQLNERRYFT